MLRICFAFPLLLFLLQSFVVFSAEHAVNIKKTTDKFEMQCKPLFFLREKDVAVLCNGEHILCHLPQMSEHLLHWAFPIDFASHGIGALSAQLVAFVRPPVPGAHRHALASRKFQNAQARDLFTPGFFFKKKNQPMKSLIYVSAYLICTRNFRH